MFSDDLGETSFEHDDESCRFAAGLRIMEAVLGADVVTVAVWYPASPGSVCREFRYGGEPASFRLAAVAVEATPVAPPVPCPLLLLAGAADGTAFDLGWLGVHLACRGHVVVGVGGTADPAAFALRLRALAERVDAEQWLTGLHDPQRCVVAGFDVGGIAALALAGARLADTPASAAMHAPLAGAVALLNPYPADRLTRLRRGDVTVPVHVIVSAADREAPPAAHGERLAAGIRGARITRLAGPVGHHVFRGEPTPEGRRRDPALTIDAAVVHRGSVHERTAMLVEALIARAVPTEVLDAPGGSC